MEDEDGTPNKRGEAYCACRYLNCGRKFKSLKALEEHLISIHNISWEAYTRYSPSRHHETIEEAAIDPLGKRKDAYCTCTFMECGRKFKMLKNLEEHVTLYHNISWQLYTQYYHRSVRKAPEVEKSKSPKVEKKPPLYSTAIKTSDSPSPSSSTARSTSNGSASTTPVSIAMGISSPVAGSPMMSFLSPQTNATYGQYPYLTAQVPLVPTIIQYQPMLTPAVLGYGSPTISSIPQGYLSQPAPIPMSPIPEPPSWYQSSSSHLLQQQPQQESEILNLSCPKSKKTRPSSPPATTLDLSMSKSSRSYCPAATTSQPQHFTDLNVPSPTYVNSYSKQISEKPYKHPAAYCPIAPKAAQRDARWAGQTNQPQVKHSEWGTKDLPDTRNGVIVIQPDDYYEDRSVKANHSLSHTKDHLEDSMYMYTKAYCEEMYQRSFVSSASYSQDTSRDYSRLGAWRTYQSAYSPKVYHQQERVEDLSRSSDKYPTDQASNLSLKHSIGSPISSPGVYGALHKNQMNPVLEKKTNEIFAALSKSKAESVERKSTAMISSKRILDRACTKETKSPLNEKQTTVDTKANLVHQVSTQLKKVLRKSSGMELATSMSQRATFPVVRKIKRSSSMPNLNTCAEEVNETFHNERLVIDIQDEDLPKKKVKKIPEIHSHGVKSLLNLENYPSNIEESKKPKLMESCHLNLKSKCDGFNTQKEFSRPKLTDIKKRIKNRNPPIVLFRSTCIKRKYRHLSLRKRQGSERKHPSLFCRMRLKAQTKFPNSCRLCQKNCDSDKTIDTNNPIKKLKRQMGSKPNNKTTLVSNGPILISAQAMNSDVTAIDAASAGFSTDELSVYKQAAHRSLTEMQQFDDHDDDSLLNSSIEKVKKVTKYDQRMDSSNFIERIVNKVWPLKMLAESTYRTFWGKPTNNPLEDKSNSSHKILSSLSSPEDVVKYTIDEDLTQTITESQHGSISRQFALQYQWRSFKFIHSLSETTKTGKDVLHCSCCNMDFIRSSDYMRHRLMEHQVYSCKLCMKSESKKSNLYRYPATVTRHLMVDHGIVAALDPKVWVTQDVYGGVDLLGVPYIDKLDQLSLVTDDKIYTPDAIYTYILHCGLWALGNISTAYPRQVAAQSSSVSDEHEAPPPSHQGRLGQPFETLGGAELKMSDLYPTVLVAIVDCVRRSSNGV